MTTQKSLGLFVKCSVVIVLVAIFIATLNTKARADKKCELALKNLEKEIHAFMMENRAYAKTLGVVVKTIKKSAKSYKVDKKIIAAIASDTSVSKKEATKTRKMEKKLVTVRDELKTVEGATKKMRDKLGEVADAYDKVDNDCDAER
jgi:hypothetical protein